jgi:hypothetical protein
MSRPAVINKPFSPGVDPAILDLARALARQAAREDHAREMAKHESGNLRPILDRPAE